MHLLLQGWGYLLKLLLERLAVLDVYLVFNGAGAAQFIALLCEYIVVGPGLAPSPPLHFLETSEPTHPGSISPAASLSCCH